MTGKAVAAMFVVLMLPLTASAGPLSSPGTAGGKSCVEAIGYPVTQRPHVAFRRLEADNPKIGSSREMSLAITNAEQAAMWAVKHVTA